MAHRSAVPGSSAIAHLRYLVVQSRQGDAGHGLPTVHSPRSAGLRWPTGDSGHKGDAPDRAGEPGGWRWDRRNPGGSPHTYEIAGRSSHCLRGCFRQRRSAHSWRPPSDMRLKLDENLPARLVGELSALGHDVDTVPEQGLKGSPDPPRLERSPGIGTVPDHPGSRLLRSQGFQAWHAPRHSPCPSPRALASIPDRENP